MIDARDRIAAMTAAHPETIGMLALHADGTIAELDPDLVDRGEIAFHQATGGGAWPQVGDHPRP